MTTPPRDGRRSASPPSPIDDGFALTGPSRPLDPEYHAYRKDLADTALASMVIASHYAEPLPKTLVKASTLFAELNDLSNKIKKLATGEAFAMLDCTRGWAWGYAGAERRVGYVPADALSGL